MTSGQLAAALEAMPFRPFRMRLADGQALDVRHPEQVTSGMTPRTVWVDCRTATDHRALSVDLLLVVALEFAVAHDAASGGTHATD